MNKKHLIAVAALAFSAPALAESIVGLREDNYHLVSFDSAAPGTITGDVAVTGLPAFSPVAMDYNAATSSLLLSATAGGGVCQLYSLNTTTGAATAVGSTYSCTGGVGEVDFNPTNGRVRVLRGAENYRLDAATGAKTSETVAAYVSGDAGAGTTPDISGVAYDRNTSGASLTTLFAVDAARDTLVRVGSVDGTPDAPGTGKLTTIGALGFSLLGDAPFDISGASGTAYIFDYAGPFAAGVNGKLRTVNLSTGAAGTGVKIGTDSFNFLAMTVAPGVTVGTGAAPGTGGSSGSSGGGGGSFGLGLISVLLGLRLLRRAVG